MFRAPERLHWAVAGVALLATGCGAAYYGAALGVVATQKDKKVIDTSFPDAVLTSSEVPPYVRMTLSTAEVTISRDTTVFNPGGAAPVGPTSLTGHEVLAWEFPPGFGEALSNRDAGTSILAGDRLVVRVNGDDARELAFDASDAVSTGSGVAAAIQAKVRALTSNSPGVPAAAYTLFLASYDATAGAYRFESGAPGEASEVVFEPAPRAGRTDAAPNAASAATAARLGLGVERGAIERSGGDSISFVVMNRGTDVIPAGTGVSLFLSRDKVLDPRFDLPIDRVALDRPVEVGQAKLFVRRNGNAPPTRLLRGDVAPGAYYLIFEIEPSGGERLTDNNVLVSTTTLEVLQPVDDPATPAAETADPLDIVPVSTKSPIAVVTGNVLTTVVTLANVGGPVGVGGVPVDLELVLSSDARFDEPAAFRDPAGALAGVRVNPTDPSQPFVIRVLTTGASAVPVAAVAGNVITVSFDGQNTATVQQFIDALNGVQNSPVDAFADGVGTPGATQLAALLTAAGTLEVTARDVFVAHRRVTFAASERQLHRQAFALEAPLRQQAFRASILPVKLTPLFRARPVLAGADPQDPTNDVRRASNFVRVYDRAAATFDAVTGATIPTVNTDDFAALDAVTLRPVNTGSIRQGQQRVFRFEIPATGLTNDESQLLVILRTNNFDAHLDLFGGSGTYITGSDDGILGRDPLVYTAVQAGNQNRSFYLVVSTARADESDLRGGSETFELTISVNPRRPTDPGLVAAVFAGDVLTATPRAYGAGSSRTVNDVLIPFSLANGRAELCFILPERARVRFASRPVFTVGSKTVITRFLKGAVPAPVEQQAVLDASGTRIVYRPTGAGIESSHVLERGLYTVAFETTSNTPDTQPLRLEVDTLFLPD